MSIPDTPHFFLTSARLKFCTWAETDLDLAVSLWGDPAISRLIDARGKLTVAQVRRKLREEIDTQIKYGFQYWPIFLIEDNLFAGCCGLRPHDNSIDKPEMGVHILPAFWRRGLAREAARAVMAYAFGALSASGLFAGHHPDNDASRALLGQLGFRYTHDELYAPTGLHHPSYMITAEDYAVMKTSDNI